MISSGYYDFWGIVLRFGKLMKIDARAWELRDSAFFNSRAPVQRCTSEQGNAQPSKRTLGTQSLKRRSDGLIRDHI